MWVSGRHEVWHLKGMAALYAGKSGLHQPAELLEHTLLYPFLQHVVLACVLCVFALCRRQTLTTRALACALIVVVVGKHPLSRLGALASRGHIPTGKQRHSTCQEGCGGQEHCC